ncbi:hypothetical protein ACUOFC_63130, partial [Escherichia sp. TWPC-MK]
TRTRFRRTTAPPPDSPTPPAPLRSMGEMLFLEPVTGSFAVYAHRYMSPFFGYLTAWSYWFMWMAVGISEITAIGVYVQFWF